MIINKSLSMYELRWLELMLSKEFVYREQIIEQLNQAKIHREYTDYYLLLKFEVCNVDKIENATRVPVEMVVYKKNQVPTQFLLHIFRGYVYELEIFNADSSQINEELIFNSDEVDIIINC